MSKRATDFSMIYDSGGYGNSLAHELLQLRASMTPSVSVPAILQIPAQPIPVSAPSAVFPTHANELCDQLMEHTFECDSCINGDEGSCEVFCKLRDEVYRVGGPTRGIGFAM